MKPEQSKSFQYSEKTKNRNHLFSNKQSLRPKGSFLKPIEIPFSIAARKILKGIMRLVVALRYQFHKVVPNANRLPWLKIAAAAALAFIVLRRDLQLNVNLQSPFKQQVSDDSESRTTTFSQAGSIAQPLSLEPAAAPTPPVDPFADLSSDDEATLRDKAYIRRFKDIAITEMEKYGIPASVKMAQGLLESNAGSSRLATKNNNHFGIKCFSKSCGKGHCSNFHDDHHKDFFRIYKSAWESWRSHSKMIANGRYKPLLKHGSTNYKAWAKDLKKLGYATDSRYTEKLIRTIEKYQLYHLDK